MPSIALLWMVFFIRINRIMTGKKILVGVSASIAAYKIPQLVRMLLKAGAEVQVMMTPKAKDFVSSLVLSTLTRKPVLIEMFDEETWSNHVMLGRWANVLLMAPASCNTLAKMANGLCDNFLLATYMSATCPVMIAPAMDEDMWLHAATKKNIQTLTSFGHQLIKVQHGELASGLIGMGRMAELEDIVAHLDTFFAQHQDLANHQILISAGPTYENLDPVRYIGNYSTGKMGIAIAMECANRGAKVHLVLGPSQLQITHPNITVKRVVSAQNMYDACVEIFPACNIAIMSAAVADYTPLQVATEKIKKKTDEFTITLTKTKDILKQLGTIKTAQQTLVGFALESVDEKNYAIGKLASKNADIIVLNSVKDEGAGFGHDTNKVTIFDKHGAEETHSLKSKAEVAKDIINKIIQYNTISKS
jgi:phosphopantothenoylcysteine decarboxylase / phosphopantothenate---cysteine ligase